MYLIFDCETTGLPKRWDAPATDLDNWPRAIQIAWSLCDKTGCQTASAVRLIKPEGFVIPAEVQRIHGIATEQALSEGENLVDVLQSLGDAVQRAEILVAHNLKFDEKVLSAEYFRMKLKPPFSDKKRFCTMENSAAICRIPGPRGYKWPSLSQLHRVLFNRNFEDAHNAGADVAACAKCFFELKHRKLISI